MRLPAGSRFRGFEQKGRGGGVWGRGGSAFLWKRVGRGSSFSSFHLVLLSKAPYTGESVGWGLALLKPLPHSETACFSTERLDILYKRALSGIYKGSCKGSGFGPQGYGQGLLSNAGLNVQGFVAW